MRSACASACITTADTAHGNAGPPGRQSLSALPPRADHFARLGQGLGSGKARVPARPKAGAAAKPGQGRGCGSAQCVHNACAREAGPTRCYRNDV
jgi:hypothetical protein